MFAIVVSPRAGREIAAASAWWKSNRLAAPLLLADEVSQALARIAENPSIGTPWLGERRRLVLHRIEYLVLYRVRPRARRVEVIAFWHARRGASPL